MKKILVMGISGMLGHALFGRMLNSKTYEVYGTVRRKAAWLDAFEKSIVNERVQDGVDANAFDSILKVFARVRPDIVVNCVGVVKQRVDSEDPLVSLPLNSVLPHRLAAACDLSGARLIHISTDCVFSGRQGNYRETDQGDAIDMYGKSKYLGEIASSTALTIRTSYIGHELASAHGLIDWFLSQKDQVVGYRKAMYSGLPVTELCDVMERLVFGNEGLTGLVQISSDPISKFDLLSLVSKVYGKNIKIEPADSVAIDRTLDSSLFKKETGYVPPSWDTMIRVLYDYFLESSLYSEKKRAFGILNV